MNQKELADKLGVRTQQINKYVTENQKMSIQVMYNISILLNCRMEDLYEWINEASDNE